MPEIKRNFTKGKMNKDLDERLVPPGEYRHAQNIQVSTSEESDVGTVTNVLGNIQGCAYYESNPQANPIPTESTTVGSISDEKNDTLYWLIAGPSNINNQNFPLAIGQTSTFKDLIMRTNYYNSPGNPTLYNCEPVFVDKWGFCTGIDPQVTWNATPTDIIILDDISLYSSVFPGMYATGYVGQTQTWGPTLVTDVGNLTTVPVNYYHGTTYQTIPSTPIVLDLDIAIRTFIDTGCTGGPITFNFDEITPCSNNSPITTNIPPNGTHQFIITPSDWDPNIVVGSVMSQVLNSVTGANILNGVPDTVITDIQYHQICADSSPATPPATGVWMTGCFMAYVLTIDAPVFVGSLTPSGTTDNGEVYHYKQFDAIITPPPVTIAVPDNFVHVLPGSQHWMNEVYEILFNDNFLWGMPPVPTGAQLQIDNLIGAGGSWPPNSCIDPDSVIDPANGFSLVPPRTYADHFEIINCMTGAPQNAISYNPIGRPLTFQTLPQYGLQGVHLNENVNLSNVETICFEGDRVLNFDPTRPITGINIVDDLLFWTDNFTEPKRINIPRSVQGTEPSGDIHTSVVNDGLQINFANYQPVREEHVTVIRKNPKSSLSLELLTGRDPQLNYTGVTNTVVAGGPLSPSIIGSSNINVTDDFSSIAVGDTVKFIIETDIDGNPSFEVAWAIGDYLLLKEFTPSGTSEPVPLANWTMRGIIISWTNQNFDSNSGTVQVQIKIVGLKGTPPDPDPLTPSLPLQYTVDLQSQDDVLFEDKFPRFSYRYKYLDGEYSTFAPWSEVAFAPGNFDYDPKRGWNTGMVNNLTSVILRGFITGIIPNPTGQDVMSVDILYKEEGSPNIYIVDTISPDDIAEQLPSGGTAPLPFFLNEYEVKSETIKNILPSNQFLRAWDNVPKKALAQELTGSRIVYGNYEQGYDLIVSGKKFRPSFKNYLTNWGDSSSGSSQKSIKSLRDYKLGVVFTDDYGRETPILISSQGGFTVDKSDSNKYNRLTVGLSGGIPPDMRYFKFYIKETSTEYYNLAMDRWYDAEDGNIWLAFPSSDRNKVDLETSLYFKKGDDEDVYENSTRYKILALENEAPDFIKTRRVRIGTVEHDPLRVIDPTPIYAQVFGSPTDGIEDAPEIGGVSFSMNYFEGEFANTSISKLEDVTEDLYIQFVGSNDSSQEYKIAEITSDYDATAPLSNTNPTKYFITLDTNLKNDIGFIFDNAAAPSAIVSGIETRFIKADIENKPKFDGRFFAKIENDGRIKTTASGAKSNYITKSSKMIYLLDNDDDLVTRSWQAAVDSSGTSGNYVLDSHSGLTAFASNPQENPLGIHWNYYYARQTYFGLQSSFGSGGSFPANQYYAGSRMHLGDDSDNGVWFINRSTKKYQNFPNNHAAPEHITWKSENNMNMFSPACNIIGPPGCGTAYHTANSTTGFGIKNYTNRSRVQLAFGGFGKRVYQNLAGSYSGGVGDYFLNVSNNTLESFFAIGNGNINHSDTSTSNFVNRLQSGFSFIWEDDPTETIYTIEDQTINEQHIRFGRHDDGYFNHSKILIGAESSYHKNWEFKVSPTMSGWDPAGPIGTFMTNGLILGSGARVPGGYAFFNTNTTTLTGATTITVSAASAFGDLQIGMSIISPAHFSGASKFNEIIAIDPLALTVTLNQPVTSGGIGAGAVLMFGHTIRVVSVNIYGVTAGTPIDTNYIIVDKITSKCENGNNSKPQYSLKKGMMLTDYNMDANGGSKSPTYGNVIIKEILPDPAGHKIILAGYYYPLHFDPAGSLTDFDSAAWDVGSRITFKQVTMNGASDFTEANTDLCMPYGASGGIGAVGYKMKMIESIEEYSDGGNLPPNPYVWETEPKEDTNLELYYEISENNPLFLDNSTIDSVIPVGSIVKSPSGEGFPLSMFDTAEVIYNQSVLGDEIYLSESLWIGPGAAPDGTLPLVVGSKFTIQKPNGVQFDIEITAIFPEPTVPTTSDHFKLKTTLQNSEYSLNWHNCYSFGNGVESNRIKDNFNLPFINNGVKVSTTLDTDYKLERRKYGLIYSGIYNSISGVNNLNQFIQAEKITKDVNSIYGSIQKLHAGWGQSGDLITLCEDRTLKILANKDALFNADGNTNVTATNKVLGTAIPYSGEFGISKNPESFASESYRAYFTDKTRGAVMRLSMDGLTPISNYGMKNWFRDNLKLSNQLVGSYDDRKDQYNITLKSLEICDDGGECFYDVITTATYREDVKGWVSFKSFVPENGISCANQYYTFQNGVLWMHHHGKRNTFYNKFSPTSLTVLVNDSPGVIKTFHTLNYEGSESKVDSLVAQSGDLDSYDIWDVLSWDGTFDGNNIPNYLTSLNVVADNDYYNLSPSTGGWFVKNIETDKEIGGINEFIEKEGKWFNYIKGIAAKYSDARNAK